MIEKFVIPETKPTSKKAEEKTNSKEVETKSKESLPKKVPAKTIKDIFKKATVAPVAIDLDEKSNEDNPSTSIKNTVEKTAEDKKKKQIEDKKKASEEEKKRLAEEKKRLAEEKKAEDLKKELEKNKIEEKKRLAEEEKKQAVEKKKADEEKKRKQTEETEKKRVATAEQTSEKKIDRNLTQNSKECISDENKQIEAANNDSSKRPKFSLSTTGRAAPAKKISLSTKVTTNSQAADKSDTSSAHEEDTGSRKHPPSHHKRVIKDEDDKEDKMDLDSGIDHVTVAANNTNKVQSETSGESKRGTKRKRSGSLANSFDESNDRQDNPVVNKDADPTEAAVGINNTTLLSTPQTRNVKRFKKVLLAS